MDYISEVLPNLGETAVMNETFTSYVYKEIGLRNEKYKNSNLLFRRSFKWK